LFLSIIYYFSIEEYRRGTSVSATTAPASSGTVTIATCSGKYDKWTRTYGDGIEYGMNVDPLFNENSIRCNISTCNNTFKVYFTKNDINDKSCNTPTPVKSFICPPCQNLKNVASCQFIPDNKPDAQIVANNDLAQSIITSTDPSYIVEKETMTDYQKAYNRYMDLIKICNSAPPFNANDKYFLCGSSPIAIVNSDNMVVCKNNADN
jgi:hypothetical protein